MSVDIQPNTDNARSRIRFQLLSAMESLGVEIEAVAKARIATAFPPASVPGEPPHRRTGNLQDGVFHYTEETGTGVRLTISYGRAGGDPFVPIYLQSGTSKMAPRQFASVDRDEWAGKLTNALSDRMRQQIT